MTSRQFYYIFSIFIISLKIQKMPCILFNYLNKDSYFLFIIYLLIDIIGVIFAFILSKKINNSKLNKLNNTNIVDILFKISLLFTAVYFLFQSVVFYEAIQDLFSHILFENLSWKLFSLFLLSCVFYIACFDYDNIGRVAEIFFPIIMSSLVLLFIMGSLETDFTSILPFQTIKNADFISAFKDFNIWFGDFFLIIFLGSVSKDIKLKPTIISYVCSMVFVILFILSFQGRYQNLSALQPSVISVISEQSLLGIDIGRIDWFFILMAETGTVICSGLCLCISKNALSVVFKKVKKNHFLIGLIAIVYYLDIGYLVDLKVKENFFFNFSAHFSIYLKIIVMLLISIKIIHSNYNNKIFNTSKMYKNYQQIKKEKPKNFMKPKSSNTIVNNTKTNETKIQKAKKVRL